MKKQHSRLYLKTCLTFTALTLSMPLAAQDSGYDDGNYYVGGEFGGTGLSDKSVRTSDTSLRAVDDKDLGINAAALIGYKKEDWRVELAFRQRWNDFKASLRPSISSAGDGTNIVSGDYTSQTIALTGLYKVLGQNDWNFFLGGGAGMTRINVDPNGTGGAYMRQDKTWSPSAHFTAQVAKAIGDNLELGIGYRYQVTLDKDIFLTELRDDFNQNAHDFFAKLTYHFGAQKKAKKPAAPAPAPAPQPVQAEPAPLVQEPPAPEPVEPPKPAPLPGPYIVYFGFDQSGITNTAQGIINDAAMAYKSGDNIQLTTIGHTDTAGASKYNEKLSWKRAMAVRDTLIAQGVDADDIIMKAKGETDLMISTGDNMRNDQNRRVEITLMYADQP